MNLVVLSGNLCKDIELKQTQSGVSVLRNTVAVRRDFKENGEYVSDFIDIVVWKNQAEYLDKYASKGSKVELKGRWEVRKYQANDGSTRTANECVVESISILSELKKNEDTGEKQPQQQTLVEDENPSDLPF